MSARFHRLSGAYFHVYLIVPKNLTPCIGVLFYFILFPLWGMLCSVIKIFYCECCAKYLSDTLFSVFKFIYETYPRHGGLSYVKGCVSVACERDRPFCCYSPRRTARHVDLRGCVCHKEQERSLPVSERSSFEATHVE